MIREAVATAADVGEAREKALAQLGDAIPENADVQFEVLEMPKKKVLGLFGGSPAKVRAFYELPDEKPMLKRVEKYERPDKTRGDRNKAANNKQNRAQKPAKAEKGEQPAPARAEEPAEEPKLELVPVTDETQKAIVEAGAAFVQQVLGCMEIEATLTTGQLGSNLAIVLEGDHLGAIVGRRGETLDALQYLTMLVANKGDGEYQRITLNIGDYREKRERILRSLARRMANQALKNGRNMTLEPMNPYERRIIHTAVQDVKGVTSWSVGEEPNRRVVIGTERGSRRGGGYNNRGRGPRDRDRAPRATQADAGREQKKDQADTPLYGRIG